MSWWTSITLWKRVLVALLLGAALGLSLRYGMGEDAATALTNTWFQPFGDGFMKLIRMMIAPLIFSTLVAGVLAMGDPKRLGSLGGRTIGLYLITTWFAVTLGLIIGTIFQPGAGLPEGIFENIDTSAAQAKLDTANAANQGIAAQLLAIIPANPVEALVEADVLAIIFFAVFVGVGCLMVGDVAKPFGNAVESAAEVMLKMTALIMEVAPLGVFALMTGVMAREGLGILANLAVFAAALYVACIIHIAVVYGGIIKFVLKLPFIRYIRGIANAQSVAFSTSSSSATLPVTIKAVSENLGVDRPVASSVLPLGATVNMDGTAIYLGLIALFAAQALGVEVTLFQYVLVGFAATMSSIGAASIPSASLFLAFSVLAVIGVTEDQALLIIALILPFDRLLDMMRTVTNVSGDAAVATAVAKWEGELDEEVFRDPATI